MVKNRDRLDIVAAVLEAANSGSNKTNIMFSAKLSFKLLEKYLDIVMNAGFIQVADSIYLLTENGREFLSMYSDFHERYTNAQELLENLGSEYNRLSRLCERRGLGSGDGNLGLES